MEPKNFFEVFSTLQLSGELTGIFGNVMVKRVVNNRTKNCIRIYIDSDRLIQKEAVFKWNNVLKTCLQGRGYGLK